VVVQADSNSWWRRNRPNSDLIVTATAMPHHQGALAAAKLEGWLHPRCCAHVALPRLNGPSRKAIRSPAAHLSPRDQMDAGAIAAQEWVSSRRARRRGNFGARVGPLGQKLLGEVIDYARVHKPARQAQDEQFATWREPFDAKH